MGRLNDKFNYLPLPKEGYYFDETAVTNLVLLGHVLKEFNVYMNTSVDNALYKMDDNGRYLRFGGVNGNLYRVYLGGTDEKGVCYDFTTIKGQKALFF